MKFTVIFAFIAFVAACFMLPTSEAAINVRDADAFSDIVKSGGAVMSSMMKGMGDGMTTMVQTAQKTASDSMKEWAKDMKSFVPGSDSKAAADGKTDKKA